MKVNLIVTILLSVLLLAGCTSAAEAPLEPSSSVLPIQGAPIDSAVEEPCESCPEEEVGDYTLKVIPMPSAPASAPETKPVLDPTPLESTTIIANGKPPSTRTWISPGKVSIGNFHAGARAEWVMTINNGLDTRVDKYDVATLVDDSTVRVKLRYPLYKASLGFLVKVDSSIEEEKLVAISYDEAAQELVVGGLLDSRSRVVGIAYQYGVDRTFNISYERPHHIKEPYEMPPEEAKDWFVVSDSSVVLAPEEQTDVLIALAMPEGATAPPKWEFWVLVTRKTGSNVETNLASRWLVNMR